MEDQIMKDEFKAVIEQTQALFRGEISFYEEEIRRLEAFPANLFSIFFFTKKIKYLDAIVALYGKILAFNKLSFHHSNFVVNLLEEFERI